jgi:flagellar hook-length control protein FliK
VEVPSISNSTVSRQTDLSAPVAIMPVTKTPAPVTEVTTVPSQQTQLAAVQTQTVQQDDDLMPTVVQPAQPESGGEQNSHTERAAAVTGMESTKPPIITIEPPTTEMVEQPEAAVSLLTDVARSAPVQQAVRGVAVQHATETVVENVQPRAHQASVKEMTSVQQNVVAGSEATGSGSSLGSEGEQAGSEQEKGSQTMVQQMLAQQKTEHQAAVSAKISAPPLQQTSPEQIVNQVRERLGQQELKPGHQQITLTLTPENLGEVKMNLNLQGQRLTVEIVTENRTVRDAILQHADSLKDSLARQNITMESFDVTSNGRGSGNPGDNNQNAWRELAKQQQQQQFWSSVTGGTLAPQAEVLPGQSLELTSDGRSRLDIHY